MISKDSKFIMVKEPKIAEKLSRLGYSQIKSVNGFFVFKNTINLDNLDFSNVDLDETQLVFTNKMFF